MKIEWIWNSNRGEIPSHHKNIKASFQEHNEHMRKFHLTHSKTKTKKPQEVGGENWLILAPIQKIRLGWYSKN